MAWGPKWEHVEVATVQSARLRIGLFPEPGPVARDNLAQDGQKLCPWLDSLILAHTFFTFGC